MEKLNYIVLLAWIISIEILAAQNNARGSEAEDNSSANSQGDIRALIVGISDYNEEQLKLNYAANDAALFKNYLTEVENVNKDNITLLLNKDAVAPIIYQEFEKLIASTQTNDLVYIYFAGHGDVIEKFGAKQGFLLTAEVNAKQEYMSSGTIRFSDLELVLNGLVQKQANVVLVLDACKSGFPFSASSQKNMGTFQAIFENSSRFLSCSSDELSYENPATQHGYFTYYLVKGLLGDADSDSDDSISYRELDDFLYDNVPNEVEKNHNGKQTPVITTKNKRDIFSRYRTDLPSFSFDALKIATQKNVVAMASRGGIASENAVVKRFNDAIESKSFRGKSSSAHEIFKASKGNSAISKSVKDQMERLLLSELSLEAQQLINDYIDGTRRLPSSREFGKQARNLEVCLELIGENSLMYNRLLASKLMLEAYAFVVDRNHSKLNLAKQKLLQSIKLESNTAYVHSALGEVYNTQKKYDSAFYHFNEAKSIITSWEKPVSKISDNLLDQYKYDEAFASINAITGKKGINAQLQLAKIAEKQARYSEAENLYNSVLKEEPTNELALQGLSRIYKSVGNYKKVSDVFKNLFSSNNTDAIESFGILNYLDAQQLDDEQTEKLLLNLINDYPENAEVQLAYGSFLRKTKSKLINLRKTEKFFDTAISLNPYLPRAYYENALLQKKLRKPLKVDSNLESLIAKNADNPEAHYFQGLYYSDSKTDYEKAVNAFKKAIETDTYFIKAYEALVAIYKSNGDYDKAIEFITASIASHPEIPDFYTILGEIHFEKSDYTEAIEAFKKATETDALFTKGNKALSYSQIETSQLFEAVETISDVIANDANGQDKKDITDYLIGKAKTEKKLGKIAEVTSLYTMAFEISKSADVAQQYAEFLYLEGASQMAIDTALPYISKENSKALNADLLKVLLKSCIDENEKEQATEYYNYLSSIIPIPNYLLDAVYYEFIGDFTKANSFKRRVNPKLLRSTKLRELYSESAIEKYILN